MKDSIITLNDKNQYHKYNEWYNVYNELYLRSNFKNDKAVGYIEYHEFQKTLYLIR